MEVCGSHIQNLQKGEHTANKQQQVFATAVGVSSAQAERDRVDITCFPNRAVINSNNSSRRHHTSITKIILLFVLINMWINHPNK